LTVEYELTYYDAEEKAIKSLKGADFENQIDKLKNALEQILKKMQNLGDYEISEFTATAGMKLSAWVLTADGSVTITWKKK